MKEYIIILIVFSLLQSCTGQVNQMKQVKTGVDSIEIIDPVVELPFEIKNSNQSVTLPESLGGENIKGYVFLKLMINEKSEILETSIMKLFLCKKDDNRIIEYNVSQGELPANLKKYASFFDEYCRKEIILVKKYTPQSKNLMQIRLEIE